MKLLRLLSIAAVGIACCWMVGCSDDQEAVRAIQNQRHKRLQSQSVQDHLGETDKLLGKLVELNPKEARRQISYHLNGWAQERFDKESSDVSGNIPELVKTIDDILSKEQIQKRIVNSDFIAKDTDHLRDCYLGTKLVDWVDRPSFDDPLLKDWFESLQADIGEDDASKLRTASRLFDWCVRNIAYEPQESPIPIQGVKFSEGAKVKFQGAGYRQSDFQTLYRGTGDAWQLAGVFTQLCRQAKVDAFILSIVEDSGQRTPWAVGVLVNDRIYLFEPELGVPIPGPDQVGIATLAEARSDASVMRRLNVAGFFEYPLSKDDIGQSVALLNVVPEALSDRMKRLQNGLTGDRRMITYVDVDDLAKRIDAVRGVADVRLSKTPLLAEQYAVELERAADRNPQLQFWYRSRWAIMEAPIKSSKDLALGRWRHLLGDFSGDEDEGIMGARRLYLTQRAPEFEIAKLRTDVDLQVAYGIRRELGMNSKYYEQLVVKAQEMMRMGKRTASYWIGLLQSDDGQLEPAKSWLMKRVIDDGQASQWDAAAVYNAARTLERLGETDEAIELYKSEENSRPHGSRIRARLLGKKLKQADASADSE